MDSNTKNVFGVICLGIILLVFIVGGYFFKDYMINKIDNKDVKSEKIVPEDIRINTSKDYIYYDNTTEIVDHIYKEDVILNFKGLENINAELHNELENMSQNKVSVKDNIIPEGTVCDNDIFSFLNREYSDSEFDKYVSVVIKDYEYNCVNGNLPKNIKSYVIEKSTGKIFSNEELLNIFGFDNEKIAEQVRTRLNNTQVLDGDEQVIDIEGTISSILNDSFNTTKALSVSKNGKLVINFIVKSNRINYNDSIELI